MDDAKTRLNSTVPESVAIDAMTRAPFALVLTNPQMPDNPIVYVNRAFEVLTGYTSEMAVGRNCRFLQRDDTDQKSVEILREAIEQRKETVVVLRNYRADGSKFMNRLMIAPLETGPDEVPYFLGVQSVFDENDHSSDSAIEALSEIQHRVKNHLSMIISMIRLQARGLEPSAGRHFETLSRRIETLQLLYEEMNSKDSRLNAETDAVNLGAYLTRVANAIAHIDGRSGVRVNIDADAIEVPVNTATQLGLTLSEVMTNSMQHAFDGRKSGLVEVRVKTMSDGVLRIQVSDDGVGIPEDVQWPKSGSLGGRIVDQLTRGLGARLLVERGMSGTLIMIDVPKEQALIG